MSEIRLSVALVTRNRPQWLRESLVSWRSQSMQPFEIVVSDDSDKEFTSEVARVAQGFNCRYVRGPCRGLYANRNNAALACRGSHIMSADDDHTHPEGFVRDVTKAIEADPEAIWTLGERSSDNPNSPVSIPGEMRSDGVVGPPDDPDRSAAIACGSTAYPRRVFEMGHRYDETYGFGALWYLWGHQLLSAGFRIRYCPDTFVWHHPESSISRLEDSQFISSQLECGLYVQASHALHVSRNPKALLRTLYSALALMTIGGRIHRQLDKIRIGPAQILRALRLAVHSSGLAGESEADVRTTSDLPVES